jgi:hypothetical protein
MHPVYRNSTTLQAFHAAWSFSLRHANGSSGAQCGGECLLRPPGNPGTGNPGTDHGLLIRSPYELRAGFVMAATLISGINSDLPGQIMAQIAQNVFDTATGKYLLLPQGSRLVGSYSSDVAYGQARVLVAVTSCADLEPSAQAFRG